MSRYSEYIHVVEGHALELSLVPALLLALWQTVDSLQPLDVLVPQPGSAAYLGTSSSSCSSDTLHVYLTCLNCPPSCLAPGSHLALLPPDNSVDTGR